MNSLIFGLMEMNLKFSILESFVLENFLDGDHLVVVRQLRQKHHAERAIADHLLIEVRDFHLKKTNLWSLFLDILILFVKIFLELFQLFLEYFCFDDPLFTVIMKSNAHSAQFCHKNLETGVK